MFALTKNLDFVGREYFAPRSLERTTTDKVRIGDAIKLIRKVGGKKVGFLGLAFNAHADDFRKSPILQVMNVLVEEGVEVIAYDPAIRAATCLSDRTDRVHHADPQTKSAMQVLSEALCKSAANVVDGCETLVVTHHTRELQKLIASRRGRCKVIDLVDLFSRQSRTVTRADSRTHH
jgi:GDP-mannose 6-dehydrogenase